MVITFSAKELSYGNITGSFPLESSRGNQCIYILYDYDSNSILTEPMKTPQAQEIDKVWENMYKCLSRHGQVSHFILDNKCSDDLKRSFKNIT